MPQSHLAESDLMSLFHQRDRLGREGCSGQAWCRRASLQNGSRAEPQRPSALAPGSRPLSDLGCAQGCQAWRMLTRRFSGIAWQHQSHCRNTRLWETGLRRERVGRRGGPTHGTHAQGARTRHAAPARMEGRSRQARGGGLGAKRLPPRGGLLLPAQEKERHGIAAALPPKRSLGNAARRAVGRR